MGVRRIVLARRSAPPRIALPVRHRAARIRAPIARDWESPPRVALSVRGRAADFTQLWPALVIVSVAIYGGVPPHIALAHRYLVIISAVRSIFGSVIIPVIRAIVRIPADPAIVVARDQELMAANRGRAEHSPGNTLRHCDDGGLRRIVPSVRVVLRPVIMMIVLTIIGVPVEMIIVVTRKKKE